jgi:hypothetical protein
VLDFAEPEFDIGGIKLCGILPGGAKEAALSTARAALTPVVRYLWPEGRP